jgi:hypothetical protein
MPNFSDRTIDKFKTQMKGGGARSNLFEVSFGSQINGTPTTTTGNATVFSNLGLDQYSSDDLMLIKSAGLPASTITEIPVPFRGRTLKIAGDRTFDIWSITVINDTDFKWRSFFERWMNYIVKVSDGSGTINPSDYMADMNVAQLSRGNYTGLNNSSGGSTSAINQLRKYVIHGAFPTNVSQIDLSYNNENEIEEFTVDLQVQWWEAIDPQGRSNREVV